MRVFLCGLILTLLALSSAVPPGRALGQTTGETSGSSDPSAAVIGLIGKATHAQRELEPLLEELEATSTADRGLYAKTLGLHLQSGQDLQTSYNVGYASAWAPQTQGWYYAAARIQSENSARLSRVAKKLPQEASSTDADGAPSETPREAEKPSAPPIPDEPSEIPETYFYDHDWCE
ncbi:MAG: hypothetical protein HY303_19245 [Candidatus Wallbacteria bacterium]|nr:hypothetical protein [Candidatus Wallbacteria bacterium]